MTLGSLFDGSGTCPKDAKESSLSQILEAGAPEKYSLSARACLGILKRAEKRGKMSMSDKAGALNCMHDQQAVLLKRLWHYIVRRLTPLECCRLQGFPDWWEDGVDGSDSARYKMWGNGMALPCVLYVMEGFIAEE